VIERSPRETAPPGRDYRAGGTSPRVRAGRVVALACGVAVLALWALMPHGTPALAPTAVGAGLAVAGGLIGSPTLLAVAFAVGFFWGVVGLYFLGTPGIFSWIGAAELGYLVAALLAWLVARLRLEHTDGSRLVEAGVLGLVWLAVALGGDALVMVTVPPNQAFPLLMLDVMLAHLAVPVGAATAVVTAGAGLAPGR